YTNTGSVVGGNGGGGNTGGDGGYGVLFTGDGTLTNSGTITAGSAGTGNATNGASGIAVSGGNLTIANSGSIAGAGSANAIAFTGGTNSLTLQPGSTITGNVVAFSTADTLALGGAGNASLDASTIGGSGQYQGFGAFQKTGSSTWTLTGTSSATLPWTVSAGTLDVTGTQSGSAAVSSGATLSGTGSVG